MHISDYKDHQAIVRFAQDYIKRNPKEFLSPAKDTSIRDNSSSVIYKSIEEYWQSVLTLRSSTFLRGWVPATTSTSAVKQTLYTQLFNHYFDHPKEIEEKLSRSKRQLQWFPPQWFQQCQPLCPSGRMGQVYTSQCQIPGFLKLKKCIIREMNLCMLLQGNIERIIPSYVDGITATLHYHERRLAFVSIIPDTAITLEQLIPQADQWSLQKVYRVALSLCSTVRDFHAQNKIHPNLQPKNILVDNNTCCAQQQDDCKSSSSRRRSSYLIASSSTKESMRLLDDWPSLPLCSHYGRYPYIAPELYSDTNNMHLSQKSNIYSLGIILWQLACGVIFPTSVPLSASCYRLTADSYCLPSQYLELITRCLHPSPAKRPCANQLCEGLLRLLMTELAACPTSRYIQDQRANSIREKQLSIAKYLVKTGADKHDIQNLLSQASIAKRMTLHIVISLEKHNLYWYSKSTTDDERSTTTRKRRNSNSGSNSTEEYRQLGSGTLTQAAEYHLYHCRSIRPSSTAITDRRSTEVVIKTLPEYCSNTAVKCTPTTTTTKTTVLAARNVASVTKRKSACTHDEIRQKYEHHTFSNDKASFKAASNTTEYSIYGADLPDLMQMGFA